MRRAPRFLQALSSAVVATALLGACSSDSKSTDAPATEAAATEAASTDAPAVETEAPATEAPSTEASTEAAVTEAAAPATEAAALEGAAAGSVTETLVTQMLTSMTGGAAPDPAEIACVTSKVQEKDLSALMAGGATPDPAALKNVMKPIFACRPKGLMESLTTSMFDDAPAELTADQKTCMGEKFMDIISSDDAVLDSILANLDSPPEEIKTKFKPVATDCLPAGATRDAMLKTLEKS